MQTISKIIYEPVSDDAKDFLEDYWYQHTLDPSGFNDFEKMKIRQRKSRAVILQDYASKGIKTKPESAMVISSLKGFIFISEIE